MKNYDEKGLVIFDLDGTLAESKQQMDSEMTTLLAQLLEKKKVAVISGGSFEQYKRQLLPELEKIETGGSSIRAVPFPFSNLFLLPTSGSAMYTYRKKSWSLEYSHRLSPAEKEKIYAAFKEAVDKSGEKMPTKTYGAVEDRGDQITFSADGQEAPIEVKAQWDPTEKKRLNIVSFLKPLLTEFSIGIGGMTSIDVTKKGIDKAFGVEKICEYLKIPIDKALYVGDALFPGGNDYAARASGVECVEVKNVQDTKKLIGQIIK